MKHSYFTHLTQQVLYVLAFAVICMTLVPGCKKEESSRNINGHEYVDLGLSVKWATCNVGADSPEEYGDYFAFGETAPKNEYTEENCATWDIELPDISGNPEYDAARANWGGSWRLPTLEEIYELTDNCSWEWTEQNGQNGMRVTGLNGNSIFLPAGGFSYEGDYGNGIDEAGLYWSSTPHEETDLAAYYLTHGYDNVSDECVRYVIPDGRSLGLSVRPVTD